MSSLALLAQLATAFVQTAPRLGASKLALSSKAAVATMSLVEPTAAPFELASSMTTAMGLEGARRGGRRFCERGSASESAERAVLCVAWCAARVDACVCVTGVCRSRA